MAKLPSGYRARAWRVEDADSIAELINAYGQKEYGRDVMEARVLEAQMQMPGIELDGDTRLVVNDAGENVAAAFAIDLPQPHVRVTALGVVRHADQGRGIGTFFVDWIRERGLQAVDKAPPEARVSILQTVDDREERATALLERSGYKVCRHFWRMAIDLGSEGPAPTWPEGIEITTFDPEVDLEALFHAVRDAFKDHWGHVESPPDEGLKRLRHQVATDPDFDPTLWFLARDGDEIAGVSRVSPRDGTDHETGYVQVLGVRRPWRRRGLGLALLHHTFSELRAREYKHCALHVDAESLTGATRLYEKAGMSISEFNHAYEFELRSGADLTKR